MKEMDDGGWEKFCLLRDGGGGEGCLLPFFASSTSLRREREGQDDKHNGLRKAKNIK